MQRIPCCSGRVATAPSRDDWLMGGAAVIGTIARDVFGPLLSAAARTALGVLFR